MYGKNLLVALAAAAALGLAGCGARSLPAAPVALGGNAVAEFAGPGIPKVGGVYNGSVVESSQGRSIHAKLQITIKQSGSKFTGIFDVILKTVHDQFPILKGTVGTSQGKIVLHFVIEGNKGRNGKAVAYLTGSKLNGRAKVPPKNGPAVRFKYSATKS